MKPRHIDTAFRKNSRIIAGLTAAIVTTAAFAKSFVPLYLIGSTAIFAASCVVGFALVAMSFRDLRESMLQVNEFLIVIGLLYAVVISSYLINSFRLVPITHLAGILIFHAIFLAFGFAAARALSMVFAILLAQAGIYLAVIAQHIVRFGGLMQNGFLQNIFGVVDPTLVSTFHQNVGTTLGLAILAALGFASKRIRFLALAALPLLLWFLFHISARTALLALVLSLVFLAWANLWGRSKKGALLSFSAVVVSMVLIGGAFYEYAIQDTGVSVDAPDAISRTIREIQSDNPGLRLPIWERTWRRVATQPTQLLMGRGIGVYPIDEGFGAPDWLLRKTEGAKHYPHSVHLEMLYEAGILGFLLFTLVAILPVAAVLKHWDQFSVQQRAAIALYIFFLVSVEVSGSFAFSYDFQFFLALAVGVIALKRKEFSRDIRAPRCTG